MEEEVKDLILTHQISSLYNSYNQSLDDGQIRDWPAYFVEDCLYRVTTKENVENGYSLNLIYCRGIGMLRDRALSLSKAVFFRERQQRRLMSGLTIESNNSYSEEAYNCRSNFFVSECCEENPSSFMVIGESKDTFIKTSEGFKISERLCIIDGGTLPGSLVYPI